MTTLDRAQAGAPANPFVAWRTRDILLAAIVGVVFGVVFFVWNGCYAGLAWITPPWSDVVYGMWIVPVVLAPLLIRKPGAALVAELTAAGVSVMLGSPWGPDTLLSAFVQGAAAELVFAFTGYRAWSLVVLALAATASAIGAWLHDWVLYYPTVGIEIQVLRVVIMAISAVAFAAFGSLAIERSLRKSGVLGDTPV